MNEERWMHVIARLGAPEPLALDPVPATADDWSAEWQEPAAAPPVSALWPTADEAAAAFGVRVTRPIADPAAAVARLAAAAVERGAVPVILTALPVCGLERFGLRIERLPSAEGPEREATEAEIVRFWGLAIVIDAGDIGALG